MVVLQQEKMVMSASSSEASEVDEDGEDDESDVSRSEHLKGGVSCGHGQDGPLSVRRTRKKKPVNYADADSDESAEEEAEEGARVGTGSKLSATGKRRGVEPVSCSDKGHSESGLEERDSHDVSAPSENEADSDFVEVKGKRVSRCVCFHACMHTRVCTHTHACTHPRMHTHSDTKALTCRRYEADRLARIEANERIMQNLGIASAATQISSAHGKKNSREEAAETEEEEWSSRKEQRSAKSKNSFAPSGSSSVRVGGGPRRMEGPGAHSSDLSSMTDKALLGGSADALMASASGGLGGRGEGQRTPGPRRRAEDGQEEFSAKERDTAGRLLQLIDTEKRGYIDAAMLRGLVRKLGPLGQGVRLTDDDVNDMVDVVGETAGKVDEHDLCKIVRLAKIVAPPPLTAAP